MESLPSSGLDGVDEGTGASAVGATAFDFSRVPVRSGVTTQIQARPVTASPSGLADREASNTGDAIGISSGGHCSCGQSCGKCQGAASSSAKSNQARLMLSQPGDHSERAADKTADEVMKISAGAISPVASSGSGHSDLSPGRTEFHLKADSTPGGDRPGASTGMEINPHTESAIVGAVGGGAPMSEPLRETFEPRFGHDFSRVRIHSGQDAASTSERLGAAAFTLGSDIFFNTGQFRPDTATGLGLLAHELAHVVQQRNGNGSSRVIHRAMIGYRQITWADFLGQPPANPGEVGAVTNTTFGALPSYDPDVTVRNTGKKCRTAKGPSTEVEATAVPQSADLDKPGAWMDQEQSWAVERYKGNGANYCMTQKTKCETQFDETVAQATSGCQPLVGQCQTAVRGPQKAFNYEFPGGNRVTITSDGDCRTTFLNQCKQIQSRNASINVGSTTVRTRADCAGSIQRQCLAEEPAERARLLKHEQGHFDITNVLAINARRSLKAAATSVRKSGCGEDAARDAVRQEYQSGIKVALTNLIQGWIQARVQVQAGYDAETSRGSNRSAQTSWEGKIAGGLAGYGPAAAGPTAPAPTPTPPGPTNPAPTPAPTANQPTPPVPHR